MGEGGGGPVSSYVLLTTREYRYTAPGAVPLVTGKRRLLGNHQWVGVFFWGGGGAGGWEHRCCYLGPAWRVVSVDPCHTALRRLRPNFSPVGIVGFVLSRLSFLMGELFFLPSVCVPSRFTQVQEKLLMSTLSQDCISRQRCPRLHNSTTMSKTV